jgi:L-ascorbate metabolism protein UlaG (beta-lactamase superfamily)
MLILLVTGPSMADGPDIERLTWAGIKWVAGDTTVFMDAVGTDLWDGNAPEGLVPVTADTGRRYAVISHTHNDHFDVETLKDVLGPRGYVICHESQAAYIASRGLKVIAARTWEPVRRGGFVFTAVPAVDGFGSHQVSWVIANKDHRVIHGGDTLWHGQWETIGLQFGPFDVAFLPINGARMPTSVESEVPAVQTPAQAVEAAMLLRAGVLVPIHYGLDDPPNYVEVEDPLGKLFEIAKRREQAVRHLLPGQRLDQTE